MLARKFRKSKQKRIDKKTHRDDRYRHRFRYTAVGCKLQGSKQASKQASKRMSKQASQKDMRAKET